MFSLAISGTNTASQPFLSALNQNGWQVRNLNTGENAEGITTLLFLPRDIMESERLLFEEEAWAKRLPALQTIIIAATLSPRYVRALRGRISRRIALIDAPVVGSARAVESGQASFLVGGPAVTVERMQPLFALLGTTITRMGDYGTAMAAKALQDCLAAASSALTRSALDWAEAQGIEETRLVPLLEATFGGRMNRGPADPASLMTNALPGDNAGSMLVKNVESALESALKGQHLTPPRGFDAPVNGQRSRHLH
ncbi:MAG TPA: NAD(P)-binding domain-containing protein [Paracoccaceae bacterium]|nr:NAD(P)-binding domain-containing protein [Paracoccaceae bacterium]